MPSISLFSHDTPCTARPISSIGVSQPNPTARTRYPFNRVFHHTPHHSRTPTSESACSGTKKSKQQPHSVRSRGLACQGRKLPSVLPATSCPRSTLERKHTHTPPRANPQPQPQAQAQPQPLSNTSAGRKPDEREAKEHLTVSHGRHVCPCGECRKQQKA